MTLDHYKRLMSELGVNRGCLEDDAEMPTNTGSGIERTKLPQLLDKNSPTVADRLPMDAIPEHLQSKNPMLKKSRDWWKSLTPEERAVQQAQRSKNAKGHGQRIKTATDSSSTATAASGH
jgi:hypothetical protein